MDKKSRIAWIIDTLKDDLYFAQSELSRTDFVDEVANPPGDTNTDPVANDNLNPPHVPNSRHGVVKLALHYTLGRGVLEALGDEVQGAVFSAFRKVTGCGSTWRNNYQEMDYSGTGMSIDLHWDKENQLVCLHLELVHTDDRIYEEEWTEPEMKNFLKAEL